MHKCQESGSIPASSPPQSILMWQPIHSGIAACLLDGLTRAQMIAALGRSNQGITYRMAQMREMLGVKHRGQLLVELIKMQHAPLPLRLR